MPNILPPYPGRAGAKGILSAAGHGRWCQNFRKIWCQNFRNPHGRMEGAADNSVLIMAIDDLHMVEFSHVGGVRFWPAKRRNTDDGNGAPELFKDSYRMTDFKVNERFNVPHHDGWEAKVRTVIRTETGVRGSH